ncbi:MAG: alpha/beta hydrolase [Bacteroidota bacterium]
MTQLLLLHGALGSKYQFDEVSPLLKEKGFVPEAINFAGHGGFSIPLQGYNFNVFANDILTYADEQKIEKLNLFGYSMGGYAALYFAKLYPDRVNKIATLNVKFNWDPLSTQKEIAMLNADKIIEKVPSFADKLMFQHGLNVWKQVLKSTAEMMENLSKDFVLTKEDFEQIKIPVLLGVGDKDNTTSIDETLAIHRMLSNSHLWVLPNTLHPFDRINYPILTEQLRVFFQ